MNLEIKKLKRSVYIAIFAVIGALLIFLWFYSRSFTTFRLDPGSARLFIDGQLIKTPSSGIARKNLSPGDHAIAVDANGYTGYNKNVSFKRGFAKDVVVKLSPIPKPTVIGEGASFLSSGDAFNDFYYLGNGGKTLFKTKIGQDDDGNLKVAEQRPITDDRLSGISEIIWSPSRDLALFRKEGGEITIFDFMRYDFIHQTENHWGEEIGSIAWSPDNSKVAYYYAPANGERSLIFSNVTNTEITRVLDLKEIGIDNPTLRWSPDSESLLIIPRNKNAEENKIYVLNAYSRELKELTDTGNQIGAVFSPDSNKIVYSTFSKDPSSVIDSSLSIMNKDGSEKQSLDIRADINKTYWKNDSENLIIATLDNASKRESIFQFQTVDKHEEGFSIDNLGNAFVKSLLFLTDNKSVVYQAEGKIYAIKVQ